MSKKSSAAALGRDPLGDLVPAQAHESQPTPSEQVKPPQRAREGIKRKRATFHISEDVLNQARNTVFWLSGPPARLTLGRLVERALLEYFKRLEKEYNKGEPFDERYEELRGGRPYIV